MIKFFRKIRQDLLSNRRTGKYFKYAIGEIVLVVIGILVALQINNWNEKRKLTNTIEAVLTVFESELKTNIGIANSLIRYGIKRDSVTTMYINNEITRDMILSNGRRSFLGFSSSTRIFIQDNLNEIIGLEKQLSKKYVPLIPELKELKRRIESQRKWEQAAIDIQLSRNKELTDELPWWNLRDSLSIEKRINYYLTDSLYKNKIIHFNDYQLGENVWDATLIRTSSAVLLWKIKMARKTLDVSMEEFFNSLGLKPFREMNCGDQHYEEEREISFRRNFIFYNNSNDTIAYNYLNPVGEVLYQERIFAIAPKTFKLMELDLDVNEFLQVLKKDTCNQVYRRTNESYLIVN